MSATVDSPPRVSIGLPVYNGEPFLEAAIRSLLEQDHRDLELIVSDNASSDGTGEICRRLAAEDPRVRYVRQPSNLGAAPNWQFVLAQARGELFKWAACDDLYEPTYLSRCIAVLDADPEVALAHSATEDIDGDGQSLRTWDEGLRTDDPDPVARFYDLASTDHMCFQIFGLVRTAVLRSTLGLQAFPESDRVTLAEIALRGRLRDVPERLFLHREHEGRSVNTHKASRDRTAWFDSSRTGRRAFPAWRLGLAFVSAVLRSPLPATDKARALLALNGWVRLFGPRLLRNLARVGADEVRGLVAAGRR